MAAANDVDLLIVGGGCAGLSLGRLLASFKAPLRTLVIEPRDEYDNDRTWCFWSADRHRDQHLVTHSWDAWRFSTENDEIIQRGEQGMRYRCIPSIDFYSESLERIDRSDKVELMTGVKVNTIDKREPFVINTTAGPLRARFVVDTRPPSISSFGRGAMQQVFAGAEVVTDRDVFDPSTAGLMDNMSADELGYRFSYLLPFSRRRALVEETRFTALDVTDDDLQRGLHRSLDAIEAKHEVLRTESGRLPMAHLPAPKCSAPGYVCAGINGGAIRASTGYAFSRIQRWAHDCAAKLAAGGTPTAHAAEPRWRASVDSLFLRVLRSQPELGPRLFMAMGRNISSTTLVRFLSDECRPSDFAKVASALPKAPFVRQLLQEAGVARA